MQVSIFILSPDLSNDIERERFAMKKQTQDEGSHPGIKTERSSYSTPTSRLVATGGIWDSAPQISFVPPQIFLFAEKFVLKI